MKKGERKSIIISSPNEKSIFLLSDKINGIDIAIHLAGMHFHVISLKSFRVDISYPSAVTSVTPIVVRIPQTVYQKHDPGCPNEKSTAFKKVAPF
jgi:hypothetical protein